MKIYDVVRIRERLATEEIVSSWENREMAELEVEELNEEDKGWGLLYIVRSREKKGK